MLNEPGGFGNIDPFTFGLRFRLGSDFRVLGQRGADLVQSALSGKITDDHRRFVETVDDIEQKHLAIMLFSVQIHEQRHFHDLMSTTYGSLLLQLNFAILKGGGPLLSESLEAAAWFCPMEMWASDFEFLRKHCPDLKAPSERVKEFSDRSSRIIKSIRALEIRGMHSANSTQLPPLKITTTHILETLAVLAQGSFISDNFGPHQSELFLNHIYNSPKSDMYLRAAVLLKTATGDKISNQLIRLICYLSLFVAAEVGEEDTGLNYITPVDFYVLAFTFVLAEGKFILDLPFEKQREALIDEFQSVFDDNPRDFFLKQSYSNIVFAKQLATDATSDAIDFGRGFEAEQAVLFYKMLEIQGALSADIWDRLEAFCSDAYHAEFNESPKCPFIIELPYPGIPVSKGLTQACYIRAGGSEAGEERVKDYQFAMEISPYIDDKFFFDLWHRYFDGTELLRALIEGPSDRLSYIQTHDLPAVFALQGTRLYCPTGELTKGVQFPDSAMVDLHMKEIMPDMRAAFAQWRKMKGEPEK